MRFLSTLRGKAATAGAALLATGSAFAQDADLVTAVTGELSGGKAQVLTIGAAVLALVAVVALIRHIRSAVR